MYFVVPYTIHMPPLRSEICPRPFTHHVSLSDHYIKKPLINQQYRYSSPLAFLFFRLPVFTPPVLPFSRMMCNECRLLQTEACKSNWRFLVSFLFTLRSVVWLLLASVAKDRTQIRRCKCYWLSVCVLLNLLTKCRIIFSG